MNFKIDPKELDQIVDGNKYFRAYHMNKKMWATVVLDGRLPTEEILKRIDESYRLTGKKQ
ncbi:MAG: MmcQ/YjbR family DNA-binding protein [Clostridia bacterium]|nr:MmcQ/YjbR family DNA-binding protein [Clostridia bacterium]